MAWWIIGTAHLGNDQPHRAPRATQPHARRSGANVPSRASTEDEGTKTDSVA
jgi:hypothetical protein